MENVKWWIFLFVYLFVLFFAFVAVVVVLSSQCQVKVPTQAGFYQLNVICNACCILKKCEFFLPKSLRSILFNLSRFKDVTLKQGVGNKLREQEMKNAKKPRTGNVVTDRS